MIWTIQYTAILKIPPNLPYLATLVLFKVKLPEKRRQAIMYVLILCVENDLIVSNMFDKSFNCSKFGGWITMKSPLLAYN